MNTRFLAVMTIATFAGCGSSSGLGTDAPHDASSGCDGCTDSGAPADATQPPAASAKRTLMLDDALATRANTARLPSDFTRPAATQCSSDPTRGFLAELGNHSISDSKVPYHWAPVVSGPDAAHPTIAQPEFYYSGTIVRIERSSLDTKFDHPFGYDITFNVKGDEPYTWMVDNRPGSPADELHTELEKGLFPEDAFGWTLAVGDRVAVRGAWILDCGHPPYEAEMHPPTFLAFGRENAGAASSLAFVSPYRVAQLFSKDPTLVTDFANPKRFADTGTKPFPAAFAAEVMGIASGATTTLEAHALLEATAFDELTWLVCAPGDRPAGGTLSASYRFAVRTGVTLEPTIDDAAGCVRFVAKLTSAYTPFVPNRQSVAWPWDDINREAADQTSSSMDLRQKIIDALASYGMTGDYQALHKDNPPIVDECGALTPNTGASDDAPTVITTGADTQPFPFYGRARVSWAAPLSSRP